MPANSPIRRRLVGLRRDAQIDLALARLARLVRLDREYGTQLNEAGRRLLRASTFSAYCDCRTLDMGAQAEAILTTGQATRAPRASASVEAPAEALA